MNMREEVTFSRNTDAVMIPSGERVLVPNGSVATIGTNPQNIGASPSTPPRLLGDVLRHREPNIIKKSIEES